jgi:hypothetical protein
MKEGENTPLKNFSQDSLFCLQIKTWKISHKYCGWDFKHSIFRPFSVITWSLPAPLFRPDTGLRPAHCPLPPKDINPEDSNTVDSKRFWRWCITHRINGVLDFYHVWYSREHSVSETGSVSVLRSVLHRRMETDPVSETSYSLEYQTMEKAQRPSNSVCNTDVCLYAGQTSTFDVVYIRRPLLCSSIETWRSRILVGNSEGKRSLLTTIHR